MENRGPRSFVIPRAIGADQESWKIAAAMGSLVPGAYVCQLDPDRLFKGRYTVWRGRLCLCSRRAAAGEDRPGESVQTLGLDPEMPMIAQREYPCYVPELK
jgi:hypothetical protein